uniref:Uncharacterized protein n=1 Tax=Geospiza parvula TaxID=87175 RepID=A0A8C3MBJ1_GEOPR
MARSPQSLPVTGRRCGTLGSPSPSPFPASVPLHSHPPWLTSVPLLQFEQVLESQFSRVAGLAERLEEIGRVQLDAESLRSQLSEQKVGLHRAAPQLSERMDLLLECLERLQSRLQSQPPVRGDAAHLREQIRENSLALGELEKLGVALEGIRAQGEELLATPGRPDIRVPVRALLSQWGCLRGRCQERERWLRELLALAERFWHGLSELAVALSDTQQLVLGLEEAGGEPEALREEIDALQGELDTLGSLGVELMASCGDPDKPDVTKSLDDVSVLGAGVREGHPGGVGMLLVGVACPQCPAVPLTPAPQTPTRCH